MSVERIIQKINPSDIDFGERFPTELKDYTGGVVGPTEPFIICGASGMGKSSIVFNILCPPGSHSNWAYCYYAKGNASNDPVVDIGMTRAIQPGRFIQISLNKLRPSEMSKLAANDTRRNYVEQFLDAIENEFHELAVELKEIEAHNVSAEDFNRGVDQGKIKAPKRELKPVFNIADRIPRRILIIDDFQGHKFPPNLQSVATKSRKYNLCVGLIAHKLTNISQEMRVAFPKMFLMDGLGKPDFDIAIANWYWLPVDYVPRLKAVYDHYVSGKGPGEFLIINKNGIRSGYYNKIGLDECIALDIEYQKRKKAMRIDRAI